MASASDRALPDAAGGQGPLVGAGGGVGSAPPAVPVTSVRAELERLSLERFALKQETVDALMPMFLHWALIIVRGRMKGVPDPPYDPRDSRYGMVCDALGTIPNADASVELETWMDGVRAHNSKNKSA